ncbi:putative ethanolamine kinase [Aspergillus clavatus NRRL 1]|uniref:ethanolamine kinase n=1 Tax=Aspergillus clavatus (strain ATCC 1007 / CBS 513.65 / DSM 816 / NCTC 3887 / NRRL 1 / QM 1276 / 107) TaxID=344612 RepID=A1CPX3_ASPCL|nr:ethanolamine kinase, putative [Aspergillus clavatus NRRL 1]EAW07694.1 ethanolamine kinase, putative [Aspergillus clavatus NRRL 1]
MGSADGLKDDVLAPLRFIPLSYNHADSQASALRLVLTLNPNWEGPGNQIEFVRFTDGITNTLLKIINRKPGLTEEQIDNEAVLMRAYGNHTEILIDRERETRSHALLASRGLAPPLLARFQNGLLYRFIRGRPSTHTDLVRAPIWRGVARRLGQWHAVLPSRGNGAVHPPAKKMPFGHQVDMDLEHLPKEEVDFPVIRPRQPGPSMWTVLQKWVLALPTATEEQRTRRLDLQKELERVVSELDDGRGLGEDGLVFAHCDLLCANVIVLPSTDGPATTTNDDGSVTVHFIDYEYATPSPAAFDIANHFAEWGGYDCDYNMMPTRSVRRQFLTEYVKSYSHHRQIPESSQEEIINRLFEDVDRFRGIPGLYWGVWALIQAQISQIDFDYASYAEVRLGEYYAWRRETDGTRAPAGEEMPLRECRWAQEA